MKRQIRVLLADDSELFREGLARILESQPGITVVCKCDDGTKVVERIKETKPDLVLMKIRLPGCDGIEVAKQITRLSPASNVVVLTDSEDEEDLFRALKAGARGYLLKSIGVEDLTRSIELLAQGKLVVSEHLARKLLDELASAEGKKDAVPGANGVDLSGREREIVRLVASGSTNREMADKLIITENTVKVHVKNILEKLQLRNKQHLAAYAVRQGLAQDITYPEDKPEDRANTSAA